MPPLPQEITAAIQTFWNSPAKSQASKNAMVKVADYCIKHKLHLWRVLDKAKAARALAEVTKDALLGSNAITVAGEEIAAEGAAEVTAEVTAEVVAETVLGEAAVGTGTGVGTVAAGLAFGEVVVIVVLVAAIVALFAWGMHSWNEMEKLGKAQDKQRALEKGLRSVVPYQSPGLWDPRRAGHLG
jgi:hypothetical protein